MNPTPRLPAVTDTQKRFPQFQQILIEKRANFVGRDFIFTAIADFLQKSDRGYFTIVGAPGSGKSAILAKYVTETPHTAYYNAQVEGKNQADLFLTMICHQLMEIGKREWKIENKNMVIPDNVAEGSWFLSLLLQKISDKLTSEQRLIIAIDGLDTVNINSKTLGANLFFLPRYLPKNVYFILTRRPFLREKSGLLIETPYKVLDLGNYSEQNRADVQIYIQHYLQCSGINDQRLVIKAHNISIYSSLLNEHKNKIKYCLSAHSISYNEFIETLTAQSENNFMYLSQVLHAIAQGFYSHPFQYPSLPPDLEVYYKKHWQKIKGEKLSAVELKVLKVLIEQDQLISVATLSHQTNEDDYDIEQVLENWIEFLQLQPIGGDVGYRFYHTSFRDWLNNHAEIEL